MRMMSGSLGVEVVCDHRFLGGFLGGASARDAFVLAKVDQWVSDIHHLSHMAELQPQAAYAVLTKSLQREWIFLQRVVQMCCTLFANLETTLLSSFFPAMFGCEIRTENVFSSGSLWGSWSGPSCYFCRFYVCCL